MALSNKFNLPEEIVRALTKNRYVPDDDSGQVSDYSASTIIAPVQQTILKRRYPEGKEGDVIDYVFMMFGSIAHQLLEEHGSDNAIVEKRFYTKVLGKTISGQVDHLRDNIITDYKTTTAYKVKYKSYKDWEAQLNIYAYLAEVNGYPVDSIRIIAIIRDWDANSYEANYPEAPIVTIDLLKWPKDFIEQYIHDKILGLTQAESLSEDAISRLYPCSDEDRWIQVLDYAVIKDGGKRATKKFDNMQEAELFAQSKGKDYKAIMRTSKPRRCMKYCSASPYCSQYKKYLEENPIATEEAEEDSGQNA
jgi:hypothetical protein